ncbi:hypothetical protein [Aliiruegeria lutimaris]|uniref:Antitoxin Xre/MbcA/ParS-like toxin-binding domain-containing protein n=1 Tax=Aliiruegeria lutimaris TaxID=571298 RepID=A0A1G9PF60_9RHOB|nr:hypothetical protein [Aliiruegeria lutimaris]SDL97420.1 hypothetical protein SAMN04488026_11403 [Aliiruegeria lutimaris]
MARANGVDGLIGFIGKDNTWRERLLQVIDEHIGPALEEFDLEFGDLDELLGDPWPMTLWGCAFEDLLGRTYGAGETNVVDVYLGRRGWNESAEDRAYLASLRATAPSLYEVSQIVPGKSMELRDLLSDADPVTVREKSATRILKPWDRIAVRVVPQGKDYVISGALLHFPAEAAEFLLDGLRQTLDLDPESELRLDEDVRRCCAPLFANAWLFTQLPKILDPEMPTLTNSSGDLLEFHDLRFALSTGVLQKDVLSRLSKRSDLVPEGQKAWSWITAAPETRSAQGGGMTLDTSMGGQTVLGYLELKGKVLTLSVNSAERAGRGRVMLTDTLGDLVKPSLTSIRTVEQELEEREEAPADEIPLDIARQIVHEHLDRHYRDTLDQPIPALGGKTPRQAARSADGRTKVIAWLKHIENSSARNMESPMAEYDFRWMWEELGVLDART